MTGLHFGLWWTELDRALADKKLRGASGEEARYFFEAQYWPSTAASLIAEERTITGDLEGGIIRALKIVARNA